MPLYACASTPCIRVLTTSNGMVRMTLMKPAEPPASIACHVGMSAPPLALLIHFLRVSYVVKRMLWFPVCFAIVGRTPR